jgi:hypothetical protein
VSAKSWFFKVPLVFGVEGAGRSVEVCVGIGPVFAVYGLVVVLGRFGDLDLGGGRGAARRLGGRGRGLLGPGGGGDVLQVADGPGVGAAPGEGLVV